jgi:hypothetical protein
MKALRYALDGPRPAGLEQALADLDVSALVDDDGWPQIRYTLASEGGMKTMAKIIETYGGMEWLRQHRVGFVKDATSRKPLSAS